MDNKNADIHIMATLDDICWTFNIRGCDVECNPVIMAYSVITKNECISFIQMMTDSMIRHLPILEKAGVEDSAI